MKVLVIGGTRYMGKLLVQNLLNEGHDVSIISRGNQQPNWWNQIKHIKADRSNKKELESGLKGMEFDWVYDSQAYRKEHVEDFGNLMNGRVGKYLFVSTGSIYSKWDYGTPEEALLDFELNIPFKENQVNWDDLPYDYDPKELEYGARKRHCEKWIIENFEMPYVIMRIPAIMGEDDPTGRIWWWIQRIADNRGIVVPNKVENPFRTLYSGDAAQAFLDSKKSDKTINQVYHIASHEIFTPRSWVRILSGILNTAPKIFLVPSIFAEKHLGGINENGLADKYSPPLLRKYPYIHDLSKADKDFNFKTTNVEDWLTKTADYYLNLSDVNNSKGFENRDLEIKLGTEWESRLVNLQDLFESEF